MLNSSNNKLIIDDNEYDTLINCTGLHSDIVYSNLLKEERPIRIIPFRGEYFRFKPTYENMVSHLVYPVPNVKFPFLGVHFTRLIGGGSEVGPNAVFALKREGYNKNDISINDFMDSITYRGFHKFLSKNFTFAMNEFYGSLFKRSFVKKAKKMMPDIKSSMLIKGGAGVRAQAMDRSGNLIMDFRIIKNKNQVHVLNAPSPGATSCLSIAEYVIKNYIT